MSDWAIWIAPSLLVYGAFTTNLKDRTAAVALWVYLWLMAVPCAANLWHLHQAVVSFGLSGSDSAELLNHYENAQRWCVVMVASMVIYPVVWYWWVGRKQAARPTKA